MFIRIILIIYFVVFIGVLLFATIYGIYISNVEHSTKNKIKRIDKIENKLSKNIDNPDALKKHLKKISRKFKNYKYIIAYELWLVERIENKDVHNMGIIAQELNILTSKLPTNKDFVKSYFAYVVNTIDLPKDILSIEIFNTLNTLLKSKSIYVRENAISALCKYSSPDSMVVAVKTYDLYCKRVNPKLFTEHLIKYSGNNDLLSKMLLDEFEKFSPGVMLSICNFLRIKNIDCKDRVLSILKSSTNIDVKCACMRYFQKVKFKEAGEEMYQLVVNAIKNNDWDIVRVAASCLETYPTQEVVNILLRCVMSTDWYVRQNSASSLINIYGEKAIEYVDGLNDKFASEIIRYQLETKKLQKEARHANP